MGLEDGFLEELCLVLCNLERFYHRLIEPICQQCRSDFLAGSHSMKNVTRKFFYLIPAGLQQYKEIFQYTRKLSTSERLKLAKMMAERFLEEIADESSVETQEGYHESETVSGR